MKKIHINNAGNVGPCSAKISCPFGDFEADHYDNKDDARKAYEEQQKNPAPEKVYPKYGEKRSREIARIIKGYRDEDGTFHPGHINRMTFMSLGASEFTAMEGGLRFKARILPFNDNGLRSGRPANMFVEVRLNSLDYYDVKVTRVRGFDAETHFEQENVDAFSLSDLMFSLDYDGPTVTNPRM